MNKKNWQYRKQGGICKRLFKFCPYILIHQPIARQQHYRNTQKKFWKHQPYQKKQNTENISVFPAIHPFDRRSWHKSIYYLYPLKCLHTTSCLSTPWLPLLILYPTIENFLFFLFGNNILPQFHLQALCIFHLYK